MNLHRRLLLLLVTALMGAVTAMATAGPTFAQVGQGSVATAQVKELTTAWTQWAWAKPALVKPSVSPLEGNYTEGSPKCDGKPVTDIKGKDVWFLAGSLATRPVTRTCNMPVETELFFPIVNSTAFETEKKDTPASLRQLNTDFMKSVLDDPDSETFAEVDGKDVPDDHIFRADTAVVSVTQPFFGPEPRDAVGDGLWVSLPALPKGQHTLHFGVSAPNANFSQDVTYTLNVV
jgi:hypothetical protein